MFLRSAAYKSRRNWTQKGWPYDKYSALHTHISVSHHACVPPHKRSKITLLNSRGTADSFSVSTLVTPDSNYNSDNSRVQMREKVFLWFVCQLLIFNNHKYSKDWVHSAQHHRTAGLKPEIILLLRKIYKRSLYHWRKKVTSSLSTKQSRR